MADDYNFSYLYTLSTADKKHTMQFSSFRGSLGITIFQKGEKKPVFKQTFTRELQKAFEKSIKGIINSQPDKSLSIIQNKWNRQENKFDGKEYVISFYKDEKQIIYIDVAGQQLKETVRFPLMNFSGMSVGEEKMTELDRSKFKIEVLYDFITKEIPIVRLLSRWKYEPYNPNNAGKGKIDSNYPNSSSDEENVF